MGTERGRTAASGAWNWSLYLGHLEHGGYTDRLVQVGTTRIDRPTLDIDPASLIRR